MPGTKTSGNKQAQGQSARKGASLTARARGLLLSAMDIVDTDPTKPLSELLADQAKKNPMRFMDLVSKYIIKDVQIEHQTSNSNDLTDDELADIIARKARDAASRPVDVAIKSLDSSQDKPSKATA